MMDAGCLLSEYCFMMQYWLRKRLHAKIDEGFINPNRWPAGLLKAILYVLSIMSFVMLATGCSGRSADQRTVYDDVSKILAQGDSYTFKSREGDTEENHSVLKFDGFYGKLTLWEVELQNDEHIQLEIQTEIDQGRFKICLIHDGNEVSTISEGPVNEIQEFELHEGQYHISIVGDKAKGEMDLRLLINENVSIRTMDK